MARKNNDVSVKLRVGPGKSTAAGGVWNISLGGVFVEMPDPMAFGSEMQLEFSLPIGPKSISCSGFVVWSTRTAPEKANGRKGIGIRLVDIGITQMRQLADAVGRSLE